jgi:hypothetical protein
VVAVERGRVRLGVNAPPAVRVDRQEVHERRPPRLPERRRRGSLPPNEG